MLSFDAFITRWRSRLTDCDPLWEGGFAVTELRRKGVWDFLRCEKDWKNDWRSQDCLRRILAELNRYRRETQAWKQTGLLARQELKEGSQFLSKLESQLAKKEEKSRTPILKYHLRKTRKQVTESQEALKNFKKLATKTRFVHSPLGSWELLWPKQKAEMYVRRGIQLDSRLQFQLGKMLSTFLREDGITLKTISRLIVLAYWVAEIAVPYVDKDSETVQRLKTIYTERDLSVRNVQDNLIQRGLNKAEAFNPRSSIRKR
jgi:hypothetical protein